MEYLRDYEEVNPADQTRLAINKVPREKVVLDEEESARRTKALSKCGEYIRVEQLSGQQVLLEGEILFTVDTRGNKMFGYGVKAREDKKIYFVRDPKNSAESEIGETISWRLKTMGRTEALVKRTRQEYDYDKKSKTKFTMALYLEECKVK
jgi:hypothetical protein